MIQRIQTVFLLLAAVASGLVIYISFPFDLTAGLSSWLLPATLVIALVVGAGAVFAIFLYGARVRQRNVVVILQYVALIFVLAAFLSVILTSKQQQLATLDLTTWAFVVLPVVVYLLISMSRRGIDRDIKLIRSMDRIR